jgi:hypothetical protein
MSVGQKHHERIAMAVPVLPDRLGQLLDLIGGQVLARAQLCIWCVPPTVRSSVVGVTNRKFGFL